MKLILLLLVSVGTCLAAPKPHRLHVKHPVKIQAESLREELDELLSLLPLDEMEEIFEDYLQNDGAVAACVDYMQSDTFKNLTHEIAAYPENQDFIAYLAGEGISYEDLAPIIAEAIDGLKPGVDADLNGSLLPFLTEEEAVVPIAEIVAWVTEKLLLDPTVQEFYTIISSEESHGLVLKIIALEEVQKIDAALRNFDVPVDAFREAYFALFGWGTPPPPPQRQISPRSLLGIMDDFLRRLPLDQMKDIAENHLANDSAIAEIITYMQSDKFADLVGTVSVMPEAQDFIQYLKDGEIPVDEIVSTVVETIAGLKPGVEPDLNGSVRSFLDDEEAVLPIEEIISWWNLEMFFDPEFQDFYTVISSEESHGFVVRVVEMDEVKKIDEALRNFGAAIDEVRAAYFALFGWGAPPAPSRKVA